MWNERLRNDGWEHLAIQRIILAWAPSTLDLYNRQINRLHDFCKQGNIPFPPTNPRHIATFLCDIASNTKRPKSALHTTTAALNCLYEAFGIANPAATGDISRLVTGIIKSGTQAPRIKTPVMPIVPFRELFSSWNNDTIPIKQLRLKAITLLALTFMLRPSDIAPKCTLMSNSAECDRLVFSSNNIAFDDSGGMTITFHGVKNDYHRDGFTVTIPSASVSSWDPVRTLRDYMSRTAMQRLTSKDDAVFLSLNRPFHGLSSTAIAGVLQEAIELAGLGGQGFSAKCFRPTGATFAIASGCDSNVARQIGRWKSQSVFEEHYVHTAVPENYVDDLLG